MLFRCLKLLVFFLISCGPMLLAGQSEWVEGKSENSKVRLISQLKEVSPDTAELIVGLEFKLSDNWHVYWKNPGDVGYAPRTRWSFSSPWKAGELLHLIPKRFPAAGEINLTSFGYGKEALYLSVLTGKSIQGESLEITTNVDYLVCDDICVPERAELKLSLPVGEAKTSQHASKIDRAYQAIPSPIDDVRFKWIDEKTFELDTSALNKNIDDVFLYSDSRKGNFWSFDVSEPNKIIVELKEALSDFEVSLRADLGNGFSGLTVDAPTPPEAGIKALLFALFLAFVGGAILNLMPCVLPVLVLKTNSLLGLSANEKSVRSSALITTAGIITSFLILAVLIFLLKQAGNQVAWGFQFQSPGFISFMVFIIFIFSLNLFGLFEFELPNFLNSKIGGKSGAFFEGMFATLLATPCSAPILGTALTFALSAGNLELFLSFIFMGLGLSLPYLIMLASPRLIRFLPKPGNWMLTLKRILAYSLLIAVLWLLYVVNQQALPLYLFALLGILFISFIVVREFKGLIRWALVGLALLSSVYLAESMSFSEGQPHSSELMSPKKTSFSEIQLQQLLNEKGAVFVNITADWCLTCKYNEATVLQTQAFQDLLKVNQIHFVNIDWTRRDESIREFLEKNGRYGIPFALIANQSERIVLPELLTLGIIEENLSTINESTAPR